MGERKRNILDTIMYLGCFCLSPSHLILFPITITIEPEKSAYMISAFKKNEKKGCATQFEGDGAGCYKVHPIGVSKDFW